MKLVGQNIALEFDDLIAAGVSIGTLKSATHRDTKAWPFFSDAADGRKLLILWDQLADKYKSLFKSNIGNPEEVLAAQMITPFLVCPQEDIHTIRNYTDELGRSLPPEAQQRYTTACSYLRLIDCTKAEYTRMGFVTRTQFENAVITMIKLNNVDLPQHSKSLLRKLKDYRAQGAMAVISKKFGNVNRAVIDTLQRDWLIAAYADHRKPTVEMVYSEYLQECARRGWIAANMRSVRRCLADKATRQIVDIERDPKLWKDRFGYSIHTRKPDVPCALYESDGTKLNLFYKDDKGKVVANLQMYVVVDVATEVFLGYSFGFSEDMNAVKRAYRMAIERGAVLPHQTRFDNGGAHKSKEVTAYMQHVSSVHFNAMAYNGQSKYIEGIIGRWQTKHLRYFHNFTGMNITAKSDNSRLNTSFLKSNAHLIPALRECIGQAVEALEAWNNTITKRGISRMEFFHKNKSGREITEHDRIMLMYDTRQEITYRKDGIELISEGNKLFFEVCSNGIPDMDFHAENVGRKFAIRWNPDDQSHIYLLDPENNRIIARADRALQMAGSLMDYSEGSRTAINQRLQLKHQQASRALDYLHEAKTNNPLELSHSKTFKNALNRAEGEYLVQSINDSAPAPKTPRKKDIMLPDDFVEGAILDDDNF